MDPDIKNVFKETFTNEILPIILVASGIIITYEISESNLDTLTIFQNYFYVPFVLAFFICRFFYKKYLAKYGSQIYVYILLTIIFVVFLPIANRIYIRKNHHFSDLPIAGIEETESGKLRGSFSGDGFLLKSLNARVDMPAYFELKSIVVLPIDKKTYQECKIAQCIASFSLNLGLLGAHYVSDVEIKKLPSSN